MAFDYTKNIHNPLNLPQIDFTRVGFQERNPNHLFSRMIKNEYILQYIIAGKGEYHIDNRVFPVKKNDLFLIPPNIVNYYKADKNDPYSYFWFHLAGSGVPDLLKMLGLSIEKPVISVDNPKLVKLFEKMNKYANTNKLHDKFKAVSYANEIIYELLKCCANREYYKEYPNENMFIHMALNIIKDKYNEDINIDYLAKAIGLNRSYFSRLFKKELKMTPTDYLISFRLKQATLLLKTNLSISEISMICGFNNISNFTLRFKKYIGVTPTQYRRELTRNET